MPLPSRRAPCLRISALVLLAVTDVVPVVADRDIRAAGQTPSVARGQRLSIEDALGLRDITDVQVSPGGETTIVTVAWADLEGNRPRSQVMRVPARGGAPAALPGLPDGVSQVRWSPDGSRLAFFGMRDGSEAVWTYDMAASTLSRVCDYARGNGVLSMAADWLAWSPDGRRLAFVGTAERPPPADPLVVSRILYKSRTALSDTRHAHLFVVDAAGGTARQLTSGSFDEHSIDWSRDGSELFFLSNRGPEPDANHNYDIFAVHVSSGAVRRLTDTPGVETSPRVSPDGQWIAYTATRRPVTTIDSVAEDAHLWVIPSAGGSAREVNGSLDRRTGAFAWAANSAALVFSAGDRGRTVLYRVDLAGGSSIPIVDRQAQVGPFSMARDGTIVFGLTDPVTPREVYGRAPDGATAQLTSFNAAVVGTWRLSVPETVRFPSRDGLEIEAWVYPAVGGGGGRAPLLLNIHGGPHGMFGYAFDMLAQAYAARGYVVLMVNPRGSTGYGQRFSDGTLRAWGGGDYEDLMAGVDYVLRTRSDVDPERLGVTGRSYGGYMNNWVITQTSRFKASVSWASVSNLVSFYATSIYQDLVRAEFAGEPWERDTALTLWRQSPLAHVANARTPTLFIHGEQDNEVHITEAEQMYTALRRRGIESVLARYPREGHAFREPKHRLDSMTRAIAWLDTYLMPNAATSR